MGITLIPSFRVILTMELQPEKADPPMLLTPPGISTVVRPDMEKAALPMVVKLLPKTTVFRFFVKAKAFAPMLSLIHI